MDKIVNTLNNRYLVAVVVGVFVWGMVRGFRR